MENREVVEKFKATFIMPVHNEAGIITNALKSLEPLLKKYGYQLIIGLDACTDNSRQMLEKFNNVEIIEFTQRQGKSSIISQIYKLAQSGIIIIFDADWQLKGDIKAFDETINLLISSPNIGGIVVDIDNFNIDYKKDSFKCSFGFRGEIIASRLLREYQFLTNTYSKDGLYFSDQKKPYFPFMLNIIKKEYLKQVHTTGDDIERWLMLINNNLEVAIFRHSSGFYFQVNDIHKTLKTLLVRHLRSHLSNSKIKDNYNYKISFSKFYIPATFYVFKKIFQFLNIKNIFSVTMWYICSSVAYTSAKFLAVFRIPTSTLWKFRANRS